MWASSTPLLVLTNRMSPQLVTEQLHMLCCDVPSPTGGPAIMSKAHTTSASSLSAGVVILKAESFVPARENRKSRSDPFTLAWNDHHLPGAVTLLIFGFSVGLTLISLS